MTSTPPADAARAHSNRWQTLVLHYPLISFFGLAYGISWLAWAPYVLSLDGLGVLDFRYPGSDIANQLTAVLPGAYLGPLARRSRSPPSPRAGRDSGGGASGCSRSVPVCGGTHWPWSGSP